MDWHPRNHAGGVDVPIALGGLLAATLTLFTPALATASSHNAHAPLGINLPQPERWGTDTPFIDEMKRAEVITQGPGEWNTNELDRVDFDAHGWPRSLTPKDGLAARFDRVSFLLFGGDYADWNTTPPPAGDFRVYYQGRGSLTYSLGASKVASCGEGCDVVRIDPANLPMLSITATDPADPLRNVQVIWPGGICDGDLYTWHRDPSTCGGQFQSFAELKDVLTFHPDFLRDLRPYRTLRFMNWQFTNHLSSAPQGTTTELLALPLRDSVSRAKPADAVWSNADKGGVPAEVMLSLANLLEAEPWFNVHTLDSDEHVRSIAALARDTLADGRRVYVEYSNEAWNSMFPASRWLEAQAAKLWPDTTDRYSARMNAYAKRSAEVCAIWKEIWGEQADRVQCMMGAQAANAWVTEHMLLACPLWQDDPRNPKPGRDCAAQMDGIAIAPYFGGYLGLPENAATLTAWSQQADGGVAALANEILNGGGGLPNAPAGGALAEAREWMRAHADVANRRGLDLVAYEGGQHLVGVAGVENNDAITRLFRAANRDYRIFTAYTRYLDDWKAAGGKLMAIYQSVGASNKWGHWGLREHQTQSNAPKRNAVLHFNAANACWWAGCGRGTPPASADYDRDGVVDLVDNCIRLANPDQRDTDGDGFGNRCDADLSNDGFVDLQDFKRFAARYLTTDPDADFDGDGRVGREDFRIFSKLFLRFPGPAGRP